MNNDNDRNEALAMKLKDFILDIEGNAAKELNATRGFTEEQAEGRVDSSVVSAILKAVDSLCEGKLK